MGKLKFDFKLDRKRLGLIVAIFVLVILCFWEAWGREHFSYDRILVLKNDCEKGTIITKEMLRERMVDQATSKALTASDAPFILGKETSQFVAGGIELRSEYFGETRLLPSEEGDRFVFSIPDKWLLTYPQTIRRGDTACLYTNDKLVATAPIYYVRDEASAEISLIEIIVNKEQMETISKLAFGGAQFVIAYS